MPRPLNPQIAPLLYQGFLLPKRKGTDVFVLKRTGRRRLPHVTLKWRVYSASGRKTNVTPRERTHDESVRAGVSDAPRGVIRG